MPRKIVITTDHEIFGNGSGDVRQHVVRPTESMCQIGERYGVPVTVFFEMEEYLAFERNAAALERRLGYDPAAEMRTQAADLARRGHDFQLHLHPQWHGAKWNGHRWELKMDKLTVDALFDSVEETTAFMRNRKEALEKISGKPVTVYRAGGFAAQPGQRLLAAMANSGFVVGSSVVKGMRHTLPQPLDFRDAPKAGMWRVRDEVCKEDRDGPLWEVPIHSVMRRRVHQLTPQRICAKFSKNVPKEQQQKMVSQLGVGKNPLNIARFLIEPVPIKLDYHNVPPRSLMKMIHASPPAREGELDVLVLIGHSKEHISDKRFEQFCKLVAADPDLEAVTFGEVAAMLGGSGRSLAGC